MEKINKNKFTFNTKKVVLTAASLSLALLLTGCPELESLMSNINNTESKATETEQVTHETTSLTYTEPSTMVTTTTSTIETTVKEPTGLADYYDETVPIENNVNLEGFFESMGSYKYKKFTSFGLEYGFDNPELIEHLREFTGDSNINSLADVGYLQDYISTKIYPQYETHASTKDDEFVNFMRQVSLYVLKNLGERLYVNDVPSTFMKNNFSDFIKRTEYKDIRELFNYDEEYYNKFTSITSFEELLKFDDNMSDEDKIRFMVYYSVFQYNGKRASMAFRLNTTTDSKGNEVPVYVEMGQNTDGDDVLIFKKHHYDYIMADMKYQDCYKNIENIYVPLTDEDLINAGINIEEFDHYIKDVAKIDFSMSKINQQEEQGQSRTRTS